MDIYGSEHCTPNMNLHCHLRDCLASFGPLYTFWCFAFERYNGILGSVHINGKAIESQLMKKFCHEQEANSIHLPSNDQFCALLSKRTQSPNMTLSHLWNTDMDIHRLVKKYFSSLEEVKSFSLEAVPVTKGLPPG